MMEFYPQIKWVHVAAVLASGTLFLVRGAAMQLGARWAMSAPLRYLSYSIDTVLLTAALMLASILHQYPFVHAWLTVKVLLLICYIVLGSLALKRARTPRVRLICWLSALVVFAFIISVARAHNPLGILASARSQSVTTGTALCPLPNFAVLLRARCSNNPLWLTRHRAVDSRKAYSCTGAENN